MKWCESLQIVLLLLSCSVTVLCQKTITGIEGQSIVLPCSYKVKRTSDLTTMCWGRGSCPNSKCNQELIWTDGNKVTFQASSRYQLNDRINQGIVSLTISQASLQDAGTYCCRIEHQGWFNDEKINVRLTVEKAPTTTVRTTTPATTTPKTTPKPTTVKTTTTPPPMLTTPEPFIPLTTSVEVTTYPPPSVTINTSPPLMRTESPPSLSPRTITRSTNVFSTGTTGSKDLIPRSSGFPEVITESEPRRIDPTGDRISDFPGFTPDHVDLSTFAGEQDHTPSPWQKSPTPDNDGMSDLFQGNVTALQRKDTSTIVIAISVSVFALIVICAILLQFKVRKQGHYPLGLDPHLELVNHAEESQADTKDHNTAGEEDKTKTNHIGNISED
ncbi:hepatitis A virus cellular receptor 1 [Hyla sarda]|uniref:hepatitis A virus cellular receptor 1 n=1 Tax=Hyla sarda TaxID=327740 RepID=UPI0024C31AFF|nr:hepatitis A virus cellular receptor 1 [Hyla sarda]